MDAPSFRINAPDVINETIDGEAIILHLGTGRYYSAQGCGAQAWSWLSAGIPTACVVDLLAANYDSDRTTIEAALGRFVEQLRAEDLLAVSPSSAAEVPRPVVPPGDREPFALPLLECYTDLQDLLLLDPVHEVDAGRGWPNLPSAEARSADSA
jgi:hypothetical protein